MYSVVLVSCSHRLSLRAEEDLFTGAPPEKIPVETQRFVSSIKRALELGDPNEVFKLAYNQGMTGTGWVVYRAQLPVLSKEKPPLVKRIEINPASYEDPSQFKIGAVLYKRAVPPTHAVAVTIESSTGERSQFELPAAKVADANNNNVEIWRLLPAIPQLPPDSTARMEEAKVRVEAQPEMAHAWVEMAYLHGVLGNREELEKSAAKVVEFSRKNPSPYIETQLGWAYFNAGDLPKALSHFKSGYDLSAADGGRYWTSQYAYAVGLFADGKVAEAVGHFDKAAGLGPVLTDKKSIEEWTVPTTQKEREATQGLFNAWSRTTVPRVLK